jgi:hypothetical protein
MTKLNSEPTNIPSMTKTIPDSPWSDDFALHQQERLQAARDAEANSQHAGVTPEPAKRKTLLQKLLGK